MAEPRLVVNELFTSIQGESRFAGWPCAFIRLSGCPLRCSWCDTTYAYEEGQTYPCSALLEFVNKQGVRHVELTGGEPLAQVESLGLLSALCDEGYTVLLETSGACPIDAVDPGVHIIMDWKLPSSGMEDRMLPENLSLLREKDELKCVIADRNDYDIAKALVQDTKRRPACSVSLGAVADRLDPRQLAEWILEDRLNVRFQLQLHKVLWAPDRRGV